MLVTDDFDSAKTKKKPFLLIAGRASLFMMFLAFTCKGLHIVLIEGSCFGLLLSGC